MAAASGFGEGPLKVFAANTKMLSINIQEFAFAGCVIGAFPQPQRLLPCMGLPSAPPRASAYTNLNVRFIGLG